MKFWTWSDIGRGRSKDALTLVLPVVLYNPEPAEPKSRLPVIREIGDKYGTGKARFKYLAAERCSVLYKQKQRPGAHQVSRGRGSHSRSVLSGSDRLGSLVRKRVTEDVHGREAAAACRNTRLKRINGEDEQGEE